MSMSRKDRWYVSVSVRACVRACLRACVCVRVLEKIVTVRVDSLL